jgi:hypothetical protein
MALSLRDRLHATTQLDFVCSRLERGATPVQTARAT